MTFVPLMAGVGQLRGQEPDSLLYLGASLEVARDGYRLSRFRPVFFAYFTAVVGLSLGFFLADPGLKLLA